jgi:hypothetical protein
VALWWHNSRVRHLTIEQAETNLRLGKALEQWLERKPSQEGIVLRWVRLDRESEAFEVSLYEAIETERAGYEIYGLYALAPDEDGASQQVFGVPTTGRFNSAEEAIEHVIQLGGRIDRFVKDGLIQDEYRDIVAELSNRTDTPTGKVR